MNNIWLIADLHFGHENIIAGNSDWGYRPFDSVEDMNYQLIEDWNEVVDLGDRVYVLGDIVYDHNAHSPQDELVAQLNGQKFLIEGNHDRVDDWSETLKEHFDFIRKRYELRVDSWYEDGQHLYATLSHYPMRSWNRKMYGAVHFYGHVHDLLNPVPLPGSLDVGVDNAKDKFGSWRPFELEEALDHIPVYSYDGSALGAAEFRERAKDINDMKYAAAVLGSTTEFGEHDADLLEVADNDSL